MDRDRPTPGRYPADVDPKHRHESFDAHHKKRHVVVRWPAADAGGQKVVGDRIDVAQRCFQGQAKALDPAIDRFVATLDEPVGVGDDDA